MAAAALRAERPPDFREGRGKRVRTGGLAAWGAPGKRPFYKK